MPTCSVDGCRNEAGVPGSARGLCRAHYHRWQRYGTELEPSRRVPSWIGEVCTQPGCAQPIYAHGVCENHYAGLRRRQDPEGQKRRYDRWRNRKFAKQETLMGRPRPKHCEICKEEGYGREPKIVYDHCHATGVPRGWLCDRCNKVLGLVKDNPDLLIEMADYLMQGVSHGKTLRQETVEATEQFICTSE